VPLASKRPPHYPTWPVVSAQAEAESVHGWVVTLLYLYVDLWIHRRVEAVKIEQEETYSYETVDFMLPPIVLAALQKAGATSTYVPLATLNKTPLANFSVCDARGNSLCVLTQRHNSAFARILLQRLAEIQLTSYAAGTAIMKGKATQPITLDRAVAAQFDTIVAADLSQANAALKAFETLAKQSDPASPSQAQLLWADVLMQETIRAVAFGYLLMVPVEATPERQLIKYSYSVATPFYQAKDTNRGMERSEKDELVLSILFKWWEWGPWYVSIPDVLDCASYHFEMIVPPGVELKRVHPVITTDKGESMSLSPPRGAYLPSRVNLHITRDSVPEMYAAEVSERSIAGYYRLPRKGLLTLAMFSTFLTAVFLLLTSVYVSNLTGAKIGAGVTTLIAIVGFGNFYLSRGTEHPVASRLLFGLRRLLVVSGIAGLSGAGLLLDDVRVRWPWALVTGIAVMTALYVMIGWVATKRDPHGPKSFLLSAMESIVRARQQTQRREKSMSHLGYGADDE